MRSGLRFATVLAFLVALAMRGAALDAAAQPVPPPPAAQENAGLTLTVEGFCSQTRLRTSNARFTWTATPAALASGRVDNLAVSKQSLETTVYKGGFEKGLSTALPIGTATADLPVAAIATQARQASVRAFQLRLISADLSRARTAADGQMSAEVENLEPGVNYTWRVALDTATGRIVSPTIRLQALVCPADMADSPAVPRRRP